MRRGLPLCAIFCAALLLLAGVWASLSAQTPTLPEAPDAAAAIKATTGTGNAPASKWTETVIDPGKRS